MNRFERYDNSDFSEETAGNQSILIHEVRESVSSILGLTKLLLDGLEGELNEKQLIDLTAIYNSGKNLIKRLDSYISKSELEIK
ncbi:MAG: hypothetical protein ACE5JB_06900 [bacterium]